MSTVVKIKTEGLQVKESELSKGKKRILVVDDSKPLRNMLGLMLSNGGYLVEQAADGHEALRILKREGGLPCDLMITDLNMDKMGGLELLETIQLESISCPPVMVCSVNCDVKTIKSIARSGVRHYIRKPFLTETVLAKVASVFEQEDAAKSSRAK